MRLLARAAGIALLGLLLGSCSNAQDELDPPTPPITEPTEGYRVSGTAQKGPFIAGTSVTIRPLDANLKPTGESYETQVTDNLGNFEFPTQISAPYAELTAQGYYFNEVRGILSRAPITLRSLVQLSNEGSNINLLTTLEAERLRYLVEKGGKSFDEARKTAQREVLSSFGITLSDVTASDRLDISHNGDENAALLAISCILQINGVEADLSEITAKIGNDIRNNGSITKADLQQAIKQLRSAVNAEYVRERLTQRYDNLGITDFHVPDIYNYLDSDGDGKLNGAEPYILLAKDKLTLSSTLNTVSVTVHTNLKWKTAVPAEAAGWLSINDKTTGDLLVLTAKPNDGAARTAQLILKDENGILDDTVNVMQVGNEIRLRLNLIPSWNTGTTKGNISPGLEGMLNDLTFINFSLDDKLQVNRLIRPVTDDALEFSMPFKYDNNPGIPHLLYNIYIIANDPESWKAFTGGPGDVEEYRSTRDLNATDGPIPLYGISSITTPSYTDMNVLEVALAKAVARITFEVQFSQTDFPSAQPEVLGVTVTGINSQRGRIFPFKSELDTVYRNDYSMAPTADNKYTFYNYNRSSIKEVIAKVRIDGAEKTYKVQMSQTGNPGAPIVFMAGYAYNYRLTISRDQASSTFISGTTGY